MYLPLPSKTNAKETRTLLELFATDPFDVRIPNDVGTMEEVTYTTGDLSTPPDLRLIHFNDGNH